MHHTTDLTNWDRGGRGPEALRRRDPGGAVMAYKLSFGDGDADAAFWERLSGYCVQITSPDGAAADYEVVGGPRGTRNWDWPRSACGAGTASWMVRTENRLISG